MSAGPGSPHGAWLWWSFALTLPATGLLIVAVARDWTLGVDRRLQALVRTPKPRPDGKPHKLMSAARDLTALGGDMLRLLFLFGCVVGLLADGRMGSAIDLVAIFAIARLGLFLFKGVVHRPRPDVSAQELVTYTSSFPSGHTFMAVVLYLAAALIIPLGRMDALEIAGIVFALVISLAVGATRMLFGIHWPSDVLAGWLGGIAWTSGGILLVDALAR